MTREEEAIKGLKSLVEVRRKYCDMQTMKDEIECLNMGIKALQAWDKFKQALDKRILEQGFDEDEWSVSYNELIKMMKRCGGIV